MAGQKALGKGLSALMAEEYSQEEHGPTAAQVVMLPVEQLVSGVYQPRTHFDHDSLKELADSIRSNGVMQPILVRKLTEPKQDADYEIIAGERRWRASKLVGLKEVPVLVKDIDDKKALEMALIENIQRQDLNALEEAEGYQQLMDGFGYTQEELSTVVGKSRSYIANSLRLRALPDAVKNFLSNGEISAGHARALLKADEPERLVQEVVRRNLNVRQTENLARSGGLPLKEDGDDPQEGEITTDGTEANSANSQQQNGKATPSVKAPSSASAPQQAPKDPDIIALEEALQEHLAMQVSIDDRGDEGSITIHYGSLAQLDTILKRIGSPV